MLYAEHLRAKKNKTFDLFDILNIFTRQKCVYFNINEDLCLSLLLLLPYYNPSSSHIFP